MSKPAVRIVSELFVEWVPIFGHKLDTNECIVTTDLDNSYHITPFKQSPLLIRPALAPSLCVRMNTPPPPEVGNKYTLPSLLVLSVLYLVLAQKKLVLWPIVESYGIPI